MAALAVATGMATATTTATTTAAHLKIQLSPMSLSSLIYTPHISPPPPHPIAAAPTDLALSIHPSVHMMELYGFIVRPSYVHTSVVVPYFLVQINIHKH